MPIKKENYSKYPGGSPNSKEWKALRSRILERELHLCRLCHVGNGWHVWRDESGKWFLFGDPNAPERKPGRQPIRIVLTIAHLNQDPSDNRDVNLAALCQRCHNIIDQPHRTKNAAKTRRSKNPTVDIFD